MRALAVVSKFPPVHCAGADVMLLAILRDVVARGGSATVACPGAAETDLDGVHVVPAPRRDGELVPLARHADVVFGHLDAARAQRVARQAGRPLVHLVHRDGQQSLSDPLPDLTVWNSEWLQATYPRWAGRSVIVRPPVAFADYSLPAGRQRGEMVTLVNCTIAKGALLVWQVARESPERRFLGVHGAYGTQVPPRRCRNVETLQHVPAARMRDLVYSRTRVLLVPSQHESWGMAAVEACCAGISVIAHPTNGLVESLGAAGIFCDRTRPREWLAELARLDDPAEYESASARCYERGRYLDSVTRADLDGLALRLDDLVAAYARR